MRRRYGGGGRKLQAVVAARTRACLASDAQIEAGARFPGMSTERKLEEEREFKKNGEKQTMDEPQEEFVADQSVPSVDISELRDRREGDEVVPAMHFQAEFALS